MIKISHPRIEERDSRTYLVAPIHDEGMPSFTELWFSVEKEYAAYLCTEYSDAFLLLALPIALASGQDIEVEGGISRKLLFNINNTIAPLFKEILMAPREISITATPEDKVLYHASGVGCGCSLGVDSMTAFLKHFNPDTPSDYRVTHLALFNCGQLGDYELEAAERNLYKAVEKIQPFADEVGLPIVTINSNLNYYYKDWNVSLLATFVIRTCACALALQKLFGKYLYASSYSVRNICWSNYDASHMEAAYVPLFSAVNTEIILPAPMLTRMGKTDFIRRSPLTQRYLDVCWADQFANRPFRKRLYLEGKTTLNCGWCDKCMRTLLSLEILQDGDLSMYGGIFNLEQYRKHRNSFIFRIVRNYRDNLFYKDLLYTIRQKKNIPIPFYAKAWYFAGRMPSKIKAFTARVWKKCFAVLPGRRGK